MERALKLCQKWSDFQSKTTVGKLRISTFKLCQLGVCANWEHYGIWHAWPKISLAMFWTIWGFIEGIVLCSQMAKFNQFCHLYILLHARVPGIHYGKYAQAQSCKVGLRYWSTWASKKIPVLFLELLDKLPVYLSLGHRTPFFDDCRWVLMCPWITMGADVSMNYHGNNKI